MKLIRTYPAPWRLVENGRTTEHVDLSLVDADGDRILSVVAPLGLSPALLTCLENAWQMVGPFVAPLQEAPLPAKETRAGFVVTRAVQACEMAMRLPGVTGRCGHASVFYDPGAKVFRVADTRTQEPSTAFATDGFTCGLACDTIDAINAKGS